MRACLGHIFRKKTFCPKQTQPSIQEMRLRVPFEQPTKPSRWRVAAASGWRARIALLLITLVAAAGVARVCTPNKHTEEQPSFGCRESWVVASEMEAIRPFFSHTVADLVAGGMLHYVAKKGDLAAVQARLRSQTTSFCGRDA